MRTSWARGGATSIFSTLRGSPAPQQMAALHLMGFPVVSDIFEGKKMVGLSQKVIGLNKEGEPSIRAFRWDIVHASRILWSDLLALLALIWALCSRIKAKVHWFSLRKNRPKRTLWEWLTTTIQIFSPLIILSQLQPCHSRIYITNELLERQKRAGYATNLRQRCWLISSKHPTTLTISKRC